MKRGIFKKTCAILFSALATLACLHSPVLAETDEDLQTLGMYYDAKDLIVSATRNPKPVSQTAENITVITAADIEMMGAHTLPDVLNNVPGLLTDDRGSIGTFCGVSIQGADVFNILVMLDGVTLNFIGAQLADIAPIPVQNIERIEIIKGPGSSSWGSALGGVVNIVTKSPIEERRFGGTLSASIGEKLTRDSRGEVSGTSGKLGYYLFAGNVASDGLSHNTALDLNNVYAKFRWALPERGSLLFTLAYTRQTVGENQFTAPQVQLVLKDRKRNFLSTLSLNQPLSDKAGLDLSIRTSSKRFENLFNGSIFGQQLDIVTLTRESTVGGSAMLTLRQGIQSLAAGADFDHVNYDDGTVNVKGEKWGLFFNDTLTLGAVAVTPGLRYDRLNQVGDFFSPSLGVAWSLGDKTVLRAYGARGYSLPAMYPGSTQEKVVSVLTGVETTQLPYLWLKTSLFWNQISDHQSYVGANLQKRLIQGVEVEARTVPLFNTSLSAGYTFVDATDRETGEVLRNIPRQIVKLGLHYDDQRSLRGALFGRYVRLNGSPGNFTRDTAIIWDMNLAKKVFTHHDLTLELFFNAHNLFNGAQFNSAEGFENARRWVEGGARFNF